MSEPVTVSSPPATNLGAASSALLAVFVVVSAARLIALPLDADWLSRGSTFLLMPSLAAWVLARRGPALVVAALLFSAAGDVLLGSGDDLFIAGMGAFAVAHVCYITYFLRSGARPRQWYVVAGYLAALAGLIVWLWPG